MKKFLIRILINLTIISNSFCFAQNYQYYGQVIDSVNAEPLIGVNVYSKDGKIGTVSDEDGYFYLSIPDGYHDSLSIIFQYVGYKTKKNNLNYKKEFQHIILSPLPLESQDSIRVISNRFTSEFGLSHQYIQPMIIKNSSSIGDADLFRFLSTQSGVSFTNDVSNKIYIRGMRSDKLFVLLDDFVLYNPYHLVNITSSIDIGAVKTVELYKSVFPLNESGRIGGMLKIYTKKGNAENFDLNLDISLMSSILRLEGPIGSGSYFLSLRRTYIDFFTKFFDEEFPYSFYDGIFKINSKPTANNKIELSGIKSEDLFESSIGEDSKWTNEAFGINWKYYYIPQLFFHNNLSYSSYNSFFNSDSLHTKNSVIDISYKGNIFYRFNFLRTLLNAGWAFHSFGLKFSSDENYLKILEKHKNINQSDVFFDFTSNFSSSFKIESGLSASYFYDLEKLEFLPLVRMRYLLSDSLKLVAGYARKVQYLSTVNNERDILPPFNIWRSVDKNTGPEISQQFSLSVQLQQAKYKLNAEVYYNYLSNIIDYNRRYIDDEDPLFLANRGESYGFEVSFNFLNTYFETDINYSLTRTIYSMFNENYYPSFHRLHKFDININTINYKGWTASLHWVYSSGRPYTMIKGYYFLHHFIEMSTPDILSSPYYSNFNSSRFPAYHRLDFHINKRFNNSFSLYLNIINMYNKKNILYYEFDDKKNVTNTTYMLPILPSIGFEYKL